jgi:RNA polymerase sigma-70 factor (ECF subfamily)
VKQAARMGQVLELRGRAATDELSDEALVAACATGDRGARGLLFERHVLAVHRFVMRLRGSDAAEVDDLVQGTFVAAFGAAARFNGGNVRAWLFGIAANLTRGYARGEIRRKNAMRAAAEIEPAAARPIDPHDRDVLARVPAALAALPHDQRVAFVLVDLEEQKGVDAAAALGVPEGTLWRRLHDARRALRAQLGGGAA